jgi:DedD protein
MGGRPATVGVFLWRCPVPQGGSVTQQKPIHFRLVGAVILVLAAVLFLPWLLDGAGYESVQGLDNPVPERPVFTEPVLPQAPSAGGHTFTGVYSSPDVAAHADVVLETPSSPRTSETTAVASGMRAAAPVRSETPEAVASSGASGWVVQVGSYGREANAREQVTQLRDLDLPAFIENLRVDGRETWRVKVGPSPQREQALRLRDDIRARAGVSGIVVPHP